MGRSRYKIFQNQHPYFVTSTVINWLPVFSNPAIVKIILDSLTHLIKENRIEIYAYVMMENHLHLVASSENLSKEIGNFKSYTARQIIDYFIEKKADSILSQLKFHKLNHKKDRDYQLWQEGSHPQLIQDENMMRQKIEYIHNNPVERGFIDDPVHWRYSSARNYTGMEGLLDITKFEI